MHVERPSIIGDVQARRSRRKRNKVGEERDSPLCPGVHGNGDDRRAVPPTRREDDAGHGQRRRDEIYDEGPHQRERDLDAALCAHGVLLGVAVAAGVIGVATSRASRATGSTASPIPSVHAARSATAPSMAGGIRRVARRPCSGVRQNACVQSMLIEYSVRPPTTSAITASHGNQGESDRKAASMTRNFAQKPDSGGTPEIERASTANSPAKNGRSCISPPAVRRS